jgi:hypothetical protein
MALDCIRMIIAQKSKGFAEIQERLKRAYASLLARI